MQVETANESADRADEPLARIDALDIARGLALVGIGFMNVEWFSRPITELGSGVDPHQHGIHYAASWFVYTFIQGKFWTLFSLLFGMGFAVMLGRAEQGGRAFVPMYLRRIAGLFLFGSAHYVLIWTGDILHQYTFTALLLLLIVAGSWGLWVGLAVAATLFTGVLAGSGGDAGDGLLVLALILLAGLLMRACRGQPLSRYWMSAVAVYALPLCIGLAFKAGDSLENWRHGPPAPNAEEIQRRREELQTHAQDTRAELRALRDGSYAEAVAFRAADYAKAMPAAPGLSFLALPLFLIGYWFVRSGVMADLPGHKALFQRLASRLLPLGLGLTLVSVWLRPTLLPDAPDLAPDPLNGVAALLAMLGMLPLSIGYFAGLICLLQTRSGARLLAPLRYPGQMALTNYIGMSVVGTGCFSGYGLGWYGQVPRATQLLFVLAVFALQWWASRAWLQRYRFGPLEWLWRALTYWTLPPMLSAWGRADQPSPRGCSVWPWARSSTPRRSTRRPYP